MAKQDKTELTVDDMNALADRLLRRGINRISPISGQATQHDLRTASALIRKLIPLVREYVPDQVIIV
jgi:hypothetical protein